MDRHASFDTHGICTVFSVVHGCIVEDGTPKFRLRKFITLHIVLVEVFFHQGYLELEALDERGKLQGAGLLIHNTDDGGMIADDLFGRICGCRVEANTTGLSEPAVLGMPEDW